MIRAIIRRLLLRPVLWLVSKFDSAPRLERVFEALSKLEQNISVDPGKKGFIIPMDLMNDRFILFSDQHKGIKNGADDFASAERNYLGALEFYNREGYHFISLGDSEELWENTLQQVKKKNGVSFEAEKRFLQRNAFTKIFGNHDLDWEIDPIAQAELKQIYGGPLIALEGIVLQTSINGKTLRIFCTHGHQGDAKSDGNLFTKFFISKIWAPFQAYLRINPNTPAYDVTLKTVHNTYMYEWASKQQNLLLITGHTHQPVFESLTHFERIQRQANPTSHEYMNIRPVYFNTGCCCFDDGDITGIELSDGEIRLVKWESKTNKLERILLEHASLSRLMESIIG